MTKQRVLIIEDDIDVADMLMVFFSGQGYEVFNAITGQDGVAMARAKSPNLILLDVMLPDMDGFDVCRALRTTALTRHIPITFLTQRDRRADKVAGLELGADDYVTKPFDLEELRLRVQISLRRASRESPQDRRTGLPTGRVIDEMLAQFTLRDGWIHYDLNLVGFREFRERYGFVAADEVLTFVGRQFIETIAAYGTHDDFAGTYSETRFTLCTFAQDPQILTKALLDRIIQGMPRFYTFSDRERGYMILNEAQENERFVRLMHLQMREVARSERAISERRTTSKAE